MVSEEIAVGASLRGRPGSRGAGAPTEGRPYKTPRLTKRKKRVFFALYFLILAVVFVLTAEVGLRLKGFEPWRKPEVAVRVEPGGKFYQRHPTLGYTHIPGRYTVFFWDTSFDATHLPNTLRVTHPIDSYRESQKKEEVWIFGCSFTYGWGLSDEETYPWLLQERFPEYEIVNFGVGGYGTIHSLLQFRDALELKTPRVAVLAYANFQDERNTFLRQRRKYVVAGRNLGPVAQPYARLDDQGKLQYQFAPIEYTEFPLMRYSALVNFIESNYNRLEDRFVRSHDVSKALILEMAKIAREHNVRFVVAGIFSSPGTLEMLNFAQEHGISNIDISVDLKVPANRLPDEHPSAVANRQFADKLAGFLRPARGTEARQ
jgi:hypothetical protein